MQALVETKKASQIDWLTLQQLCYFSFKSNVLHFPSHPVFKQKKDVPQLLQVRTPCWLSYAVQWLHQVRAVFLHQCTQFLNKRLTLLDFFLGITLFAFEGENLALHLFIRQMVEIQDG